MIDPSAAKNEASTLALTHGSFATELVSNIAGVAIETREDADAANEFLKDVKARAKLLDEKEKSITKPMNDALKAVRDLFRHPKATLERAEGLLKSGLIGYQQRQELERRNALEAASQAFAAGDTTEGRDVLAAVAAHDVAPPQGFGVRESWGFEVLQPGLVPPALCSPDPSKIRAQLKLTSTKDPAPEIPGVRVFLNHTGVSRG